MKLLEYLLLLSQLHNSSTWTFSCCCCALRSRSLCLLPAPNPFFLTTMFIIIVAAASCAMKMFTLQRFQLQHICPTAFTGSICSIDMHLDRPDPALPQRWVTASGLIRSTPTLFSMVCRHYKYETAPASSDEDWSSSDDDELYVEVEDYSMYMKEVDFLSNTRNVRRRIVGDV